MVYALFDELVDLFKLPREAVHEVFLLIAHLCGRQMPHILDIGLQLRRQLAKELV